MESTLERPPIASSPISAVVPVHNAAGQVGAVITALAAELGKLSRPFEILAVNDASTDATAAQLMDLAKAHPQLRTLQQDQAAGYGVCLKAGLAAAQHPLIFTLPGDGAYRAEDLPKFLEAIDQVDVVCGVRPGEGGWGARWAASLLFGVWLRDPTCPVRLYRKTVFDKLPIQSKGHFAEVEILAKANFLEAILTEVPITWPPAGPVAAPHPGRGAFADGRRVFLHPRFGAPPPAPAAEPPPPPAPPPEAQTRAAPAATGG